MTQGLPFGWRSVPLPIMFENLRADIDRAKWDRSRTLSMGVWKLAAWTQTLRVLLAQNMWSVIAYRFAHWATKVRVPVIRQILLFLAICFDGWTKLWNGVFINRDAEIGPGLVVHSPYAIFVGPARVGADCTLGTGVVISAGSWLGDNVYFGPGAKVMNGAKVGSNVVIVGNSVVTSDVPDNTTVIGVPANIRIPGGQVRRFATQSKA